MESERARSRTSSRASIGGMRPMRELETSTGACTGVMESKRLTSSIVGPRCARENEGRREGEVERRGPPSVNRG